MKKKFLVMTVISLLMASFVLFGLDSARSQLKVKIKIATLAPRGTSWWNNFVDAVKEIKKKTEGRVDFKIYPGGIMGSDATIFRKMRMGQLHGASFTAGGIGTVYSDFQVMSLPFLFRNYKEVDYVRSKIDPLISKRLEEKGYIPLAIIDSGFVFLMSNRQIKDVASLKGCKIWIPEGDPIGKALCEEAGVPPIPLPIVDVLTGLQTGLIDTICITPEGAFLLQWFTKVKYLTNLPLLYGYATIVLSKKAFLKIPKDDRPIVREVMKRRMAKLKKSNRDYNEQAKELLKKEGIKFVTLTPSAISNMESLGNKVRDKLIHQEIFSKEIVSTLLNSISQYRKGAKD